MTIYVSIERRYLETNYWIFTKCLILISLKRLFLTTALAAKATRGAIFFKQLCAFPLFRGGLKMHRFKAMALQQFIKFGAIAFGDFSGLRHAALGQF